VIGVSLAAKLSFCGVFRHAISAVASTVVDSRDHTRHGIHRTSKETEVTGSSGQLTLAGFFPTSMRDSGTAIMFAVG